MLNDLKQLLDEYQDFGDEVSAVAEGIYEAVYNNAAVMAESFAYKALRTAAREALEATEELSYPSLRDHLLDNLNDPRHYVCDGQTLRIFDEDVGGSIADLKEGQEAAWVTAGGTPEQRLFCWTYGIYKPAREGGQVHPIEGKDKFANYPSYAEIIEIRLTTWGDKAPYWIFLEHGNQGEAAYPTFPGTGFVRKTQARAQEFLDKAHEIAERELRRQLEDAVGEVITTGKSVPVYIGRVPLGETEVGKLVQAEAREATIGVYYQLIVGGKYGRKITPGEFLSEVGKVFRL